MDEVTLLDLTAVARVLGLSTQGDALDAGVSPRGYRLLSGIPRVPPAVLASLIQHLVNLTGLPASTPSALPSFPGVGCARRALPV